MLIFFKIQQKEPPLSNLHSNKPAILTLEKFNKIRRHSGLRGAEALIAIAPGEESYPESPSLVPHTASLK